MRGFFMGHMVRINKNYRTENRIMTVFMRDLTALLKACSGSCIPACSDFFEYAVGRPGKNDW